MKRFLKLIFLTLIFTTINLFPQEIQSGPMVGYSAMREVALWIQTTSEANVKINYWNINEVNSKFQTEEIKTEKHFAFTGKLIADKVEPGETYNYEVLINNKISEINYELKFKTQKLWQWREDAPDFTFATGSCFYVNEPVYDRPGKPYGGDYKILTNLFNKNPEFMLWLGDNIYLREVDWDSRTGILARNTHTRSLPELQPLLGSLHNYAIWDDHDFGPNNSDRGFWNKDAALEAFKLFWANPSFGINSKPGITTYFQWSDVDFFLLDNRYYKTPNDRKTGKRDLLGEEQIQWLIDKLVNSKAPFKIVAIGGQVLNPVLRRGLENYASYEDEKNLLLELIEKENIEGVIFLTGDRHHTEITKLERKESYPLYDFTISPLTAGPTSWIDEININRVEGTFVAERNFAIFNISGSRKNRVLECTVYNTNGEKIWNYTINENELKNK